MKRSRRVLGLVVFFSMVLLAGVIFAGQTGQKGTAAFPGLVVKPVPCCITGTYDGTYEDAVTPSKTCPKPETGKFIMYLFKQQAKCGATIEGKVVNPANGDTYKLQGATVTPSGLCCKLEGELHGVSGKVVGKVIKVKGILCKDRLGKWYCTDGVYTAVTPLGCGGKFTLKQK